MTEQVNVHDAKTRFSSLLERVENGEEITIARNGNPVADLVAHRPERSRRGGRGVWSGQVDLSEFDSADEEITREFGAGD